jgi:hypothetical protein
MDFRYRDAPQVNDGSVVWDLGHALCQSPESADFEKKWFAAWLAFKAHRTIEGADCPIPIYSSIFLGLLFSVVRVAKHIV